MERTVNGQKRNEIGQKMDQKLDRKWTENRPKMEQSGPKIR